MKKPMICFFTVLLLCLVSKEALALESEAVIDESNIIKKADNRILGFNQWCLYDESIYLDSGNSTEISQSFLNATKGNNLPMPFMRWGGTESQNVDWKAGIGPLNERGYYWSKSYLNPAKFRFGVVEWIKGNWQAFPGARFLFAVNVNDTAQDAADLVRFLTLMPDNPNAVDDHGVNWAQLRVENGILKPVDVVFELGNENDLGAGSIEEKSLRYIETCNSFIDAMVAVNPDIEISAITASAQASGELYMQWNEAIVNALAQKVDYLSMHYYTNFAYDNCNEFQNFYLERYLSPYLNKISADKRPKIIVSEHSI